MNSTRRSIASYLILTYLVSWIAWGIIIAYQSGYLKFYVVMSQFALGSYLNNNVVSKIFLLALTVGIIILAVLLNAEGGDVNKDDRKSAEQAEVREHNGGVVCPNCGEINGRLRDVCVFCGSPFKRPPHRW